MAKHELPDWAEEFPLWTSFHTGRCGYDHRGFGPHNTAHAHGPLDWGRIGDKMENIAQGMICWRNDMTGYDPDYPSPVFLHEYAHMVVGMKYSPGGKKMWHGKEWKREFRRLLHEWDYPVPDKISRYSTSQFRPDGNIAESDLAIDANSLAVSLFAMGEDDTVDTMIAVRNKMADRARDYDIRSETG